VFIAGNVKHRIQTLIHKNYLLLLLCLLSLGSCKIAEPVQQPATVKIPETFMGSTDTSSIGYLSWNTFFADKALVTLIETALQNNPDRLIALQRIEAARANTLFTKGALLPTVNAVVSAGVEKFGDYTMNGVGNYDTNLSDNIGSDRHIPNPTPDYFVGLRSSWEVDMWGKLKNRKKAAFARFLSSQKGLHLVETALVAQIAQYYYELLALDNQLAILRQNIQLQKEAVELIKVQKLAGRVTQLAVQQFTAQLLNTRSLEAQVQQEIISVENGLNLLLGRFPQPIVRGEPINVQNLPEQVAAGIPSDMLRRRPDIQQAELEMRAAKADVDAARAAFLPSFIINPYVGFHSFNAGLLFNPASLAYGVIGGLASPLINRTQIKGAYKQSQAESLVAYHAYRKAVISGYQEVITSLKSIKNYERVAALKREEVEVLQQAVATSNELFLNGFASYLEVVTAQKSVLQAELDLTHVRKQQFFSVIDLYRSLGGGWR
jgi:NodT family efflux transporter outer membrane factor (OMF) lipoprotein